jgi:hypothetical protein
MSIVETALSFINRKEKTPQTGSRSEREAKIKDKAGLVINIFALLLAVNAYIGGTLSSTVMNNTIKANDIWNFYQAKSIKQTLYELGAEQAQTPGTRKQYFDKALSYEEGEEGKKSLYEKAKKLESERDLAKKRSPWISYASTAYQLSIVVLSASILSVSMYLFWCSFAVAGIGLLLMIQGLFLVI